jgi:glutaredoxin
MARLVQTPALTLLLLAAGLAGARAAEPPPTPSHVVVLSDGRVVPARTRPVIAFGRVQYQDANGRLHDLPASDVDAAATRTHPANARREGRHASVSVTGTDSAPESMPVSPSAPPPVTVYSATWCGWCRKTKAWLNARGVPFRTIEVDTLPPEEARTAREEMIRLAGRTSLPLVVIGRDVIRGYSEAEMTRLLRPAGTPAGGQAPRSRPSPVTLPGIDEATRAAR